MLQFNNLSYWERKEFLNDIDYCIVGSGIVGLTSAIFIKQKFPKSKVLIVERGYLPTGASTKNAGFVCFGSPSEILDDLRINSEKTVSETIKMRYKGFQLLSSLLGKANIGYAQNGSFELFKSDDNSFDFCIDNLKYLNQLFKSITTAKNKAFNTYELAKLDHKFKGFSNAISCNLEGELNTGMMMCSLAQLAYKLGVRILNNVNVTSIEDKVILTDYGELPFKKCLLATNAFTNQLIKKDIEPARAQVLITKPIENLRLSGTFHFEMGYYYFRIIDKRILFGGGRNVNFKKENTNKIENSKEITDHLRIVLSENILPNHKHQIDHFWSGIMGIGRDKTPTMEFVNKNTFLAAKLGGMGVAMGAYVGKTAVDQLTKS